jgi:cation diffusion facilitator CzcD-associated flavoprotein CzcO
MMPQARLREREITITSSNEGHTATAVDAVVVGAGFAGMYMLLKLRELGLSVRGLDSASDVGGTWFWNRYPGARCDVESLHYSYSFSEELEQEWEWGERYAGQPEILRYANHVADRFDLRRDIEFDTTVTSARFDEQELRWLVTTDQARQFSARFLVMASGCLSIPTEPDIPGLATFGGATYRTGRWPHFGLDFTGQEVGVIGTGSSGIQAVPLIAEQAARLVVFQRTAAFTVPARNTSLDAGLAAGWKAEYASHRAQARATGFADVSLPAADSALGVSDEQRLRVYEERWGWGSLTALPGAFLDLLVDEAANETVSDFIRSKIRDRVADPTTAETLMPRDYPFGTKRPCLDTGYYETFNRDNVELVDLRRDPIREVTPTGIATTTTFYPLDCIVLATGFDAMTGALKRIDLRGRGRVSLAEAWEDGPRTYLGLAVAGFPNLFLITGPQSPSVLSNMLVSIEYHVDWIGRSIEHLLRANASTIECTKEAQDAWVAHSNEVAQMTLYPKASSWYMGANVPSKPVVMMPYVGGHPTYRQHCESAVEQGYAGFLIS